MTSKFNEYLEAVSDAASYADEKFHEFQIAQYVRDADKANCGEICLFISQKIFNELRDLFEVIKGSYSTSTPKQIVLYCDSFKKGVKHDLDLASKCPGFITRSLPAILGDGSREKLILQTWTLIRDMSSTYIITVGESDGKLVFTDSVSFPNSGTGPGFQTKVECCDCDDCCGDQVEEIPRESQNSFWTTLAQAGLKYGLPHLSKLASDQTKSQIPNLENPLMSAVADPCGDAQAEINKISAAFKDKNLSELQKLAKDNMAKVFDLLTPKPEATPVAPPEKPAENLAKKPTPIEKPSEKTSDKAPDVPKSEEKQPAVPEATSSESKVASIEPVQHMNLMNMGSIFQTIFKEFNGAAATNLNLFDDTYGNTSGNIVAAQKEKELAPKETAPKEPAPKETDANAVNDDNDAPENDHDSDVNELLGKKKTSVEKVTEKIPETVNFSDLIFQNMSRLSEQTSGIELDAGQKVIYEQLKDQFGNSLGIGSFDELQKKGLETLQAIRDKDTKGVKLSKKKKQ